MSTPRKAGRPAKDAASEANDLATAARTKAEEALVAKAAHDQYVAAVVAEAKKDPNNVLVHYDLRDLTNGQIEEVEDIIDGPISEALSPGARRGKVYTALSYVVRKVEQPDLTMEQARNLKLQLIDDRMPVPPTNESD